MKRVNDHTMSNSNGRCIHVLVVDDSAVVRQIMGTLLSQEPGFTVATAGDPLIAMHKMQQARPDVILLDLELPRMHGLTFLRKIMAEDPIPVVICSNLTGSGADAAVRATEAGAVAIVTKPQLGVKDFLHESAVMFIDTIRGAARARCARFTSLKPPARRESRVDADVAASNAPRQFRNEEIIAVGASTGGTEALWVLLQQLSPDCPGVVIVQHMPAMFTAAFAQRLDEVCRIEVKEAANGDRIRRGRALIAPGNFHIFVRDGCGHYIVGVTDGPLVSRHRPSVDFLFNSVARAAGKNAVGVIMTGMGSDGADGLLKMKQAGAVTIAQDEASCVVFGMPKAAIGQDAVDEVVSLPDIAGAILKHRSRMTLSRA